MMLNSRERRKIAAAKHNAALDKQQEPQIKEEIAPGVIVLARTQSDIKKIAVSAGIIAALGNEFSRS